MRQRFPRLIERQLEDSTAHQRTVIVTSPWFYGAIDPIRKNERLALRQTARAQRYLRLFWRRGLAGREGVMRRMR